MSGERTFKFEVLALRAELLEGTYGHLGLV